VAQANTVLPDRSIIPCGSCEAVIQEIETGLRRFGKGEDGADALASAFAEACGKIDPKTIYKQWEAEISRVIADRDYPAALRYYKTKGLAAVAGTVFTLKYLDQIMRWLRDKEADWLIKALRTAVPIPETSLEDKKENEPKP
jgi:hypothetical protein